MNNSRLIKLFNAGKFTKAELAKKCGISRPTVDNALNGGNIQVDTLEQLAKFFDVPVGYFFEDEQKDNNSIAHVVGDNNGSMVTGNNISGNGNVVSIGKLAECEKEVTHLKAIIEEKERLIQVLLDKK